MSEPMSPLTAMHHSLCGHLEIALAKVMHTLSVQSSQVTYDHETFKHLEPGRVIELYVRIIEKPALTIFAKNIHGHTLDEDFQHYLSYSGHWQDGPEQIALLREAYTAAWESETEIMSTLERRICE